MVLYYLTQLAVSSWSLGFRYAAAVLHLAAPVLHLAAPVLQKLASRILNEWSWFRDLAAHVLHQNIGDSNMAMIYSADGAPLIHPIRPVHITTREELLS